MLPTTGIVATDGSIVAKHLQFQHWKCFVLQVPRYHKTQRTTIHVIWALVYHLATRSETLMQCLLRCWNIQYIIFVNTYSLWPYDDHYWSALRLKTAYRSSPFPPLAEVPSLAAHQTAYRPGSTKQIWRSRRYQNCSPERRGAQGKKIPRLPKSPGGKNRHFLRWIIQGVNGFAWQSCPVSAFAPSFFVLRLLKKTQQSPRLASDCKL